jgi:predicted protein tyrosine phosphatase
VTPGHLGWTDVTFVMEKRHQDRLRAKFRQALLEQRVRLRAEAGRGGSDRRRSL